ncbi:DUF3084 domain-containing protein [Fimbriimonas ginsengisoli]|uniref:Myosin heavy chain n=1 Tax=Fimbriimonas ginsengisoli Gsoil 348 TaxID=661478 RepID=A0A068NPY1_FIMGI|nr:DUF3084 domain-containing protein [Fimbriimonas ginsengisoli]AIE85593.1 Myosin heavy chain [Fimbriimonas ginsengisoli Gsoil 348]
MDLLPLGFLILIVLMSGAIAVLADDLGRRLGKKRLHVRGLRPKRVAQIGTALAGVLVSLVTILIVAAGSSGVRQWITDGRRAIGERDRAIGERDTAIKERDSARREREQTEAGVALLNAKNSGLLKINKGLTNEQLRQKAEIAEKKRELDRNNAKVLRLASQIRVANLEVKRGQTSLNQTRTQLGNAKSELRGFNARLAVVQNQYHKLIQQKGEADSDIMQLEFEKRNLDLQIGDFKSRISGLQTQISGLERDQSEATQKLNQAKTELADTQRDLDKSQRELSAVMGDLSEAQRAAVTYKIIGDHARDAPPTYLKGEEVARLSIEPGLSATKAAAALQVLLRTARTAALSAGAKPNDPYPEAGIFEHRDTRTGRQIPTADIEREIVAGITGAKEPMVLVALSSVNAFKGEPVSLEVAWMPNPLVYHRDEVVAETKLDGRKDPAAIMAGISGLGVKVRDRAKQDKMLPRTILDSTAALPSEQVWRLVTDVRRSGGFVRLRAVAENDTRAGDPLKLRYVIR